MNVVDLFVLAFVVAAVAHGLQAGAAIQVASFAGFWGGLAAGAVLAPRVSSIASDSLARAVVAAVVLFGTASVFSAAGRIAAARLLARAAHPRVIQADRALGAVVGAVATLIGTWLIASMVGRVPLPTLTEPIHRSAILRAMDRVMPPAPSVFSRIQRVLDPAGFPSVFAQFEPPPASPLPTPSDPAIRGAVARAAPSTVRILATACGEILEGSGFVVSRGVVVTNAHVVAGADSQTVEDPRDGSEHRSFAVVFDPKLDVAVLRVPGLTAPSLRMPAVEVPRGTNGAVLGYPGDGPLRTGPAVVLRKENAIGRDIYGQGLTARDIYELNADVNPGNSGGPFVNTSGDAVGVVFARSVRTDNVGYALTSSEVAPRVRGAGTAPVSTGPCAAG